MGQFLAERFVRDLDASQLPLGARDTLAAAGVQLHKTIFVPGDETCFHLLSAGSLDDAWQAIRSAGLQVDRLHEVELASDGGELTPERAVELARQGDAR